jgi:site-specific DNA-methyltransferase (adenine-specific)
MTVEDRDIKKVKPYFRNPRRTAPAVAEVAASIKKYGFRQPIVVDTKGVIVVGHVRYQAARKLEMKTVPVVVMRASAAKVAEYRLADNKTHDLSAWDNSLLATELRGILKQAPDTEIPGFDGDLLGALLARKAEPRELQPYRKLHILISVDPDQIEVVQDVLDRLAGKRGVEIEKSAN